MLRFGYNTNGFAHHRLDDALYVIAEAGYESVAITLDHFALNPFDKRLFQQMGEVRSILNVLRLRCVIETGSRFLLDSRRKHQPTLISPEAWEREYRLEFLRRAIWIAEALGADAVSFWSGKPSDAAPPDVLWSRLVDGCKHLCDVAAERCVDLAFEPEPGMFVDTTEGYERLAAELGHVRFGLTLDVGHSHCLGEPIVETIHRNAGRLRNVHIEDMRRGIHEHLMFGEGEIDFPPVLRALQESTFSRGVHVELSRHSHDAVGTARKAIQFLRQAARS